MTFAPADGERRAAGGLHGQYRVSASLILSHLDHLDGIRVADPEAGRVDDFQVILPSRHDAFQIKWSQYAGTFSFRDLTRASDDKPCLIKQLADGWQRLRRAITGRRVVVHLVTNDFPSRSDEPPIGDPEPNPAHFAAFMRQAWEPVCRSSVGDDLHVPDEWREAWDALIGASGLDAEEFDGFVRDCRLDFEFRPVLLDQHSENSQPDDRDLRHVAETLFSAVADPSRIIELSRKELLEKLRWSDRFEYRSRHEFPDPQIPYRPLEQSVDQLEQALTDLSGGYIGLFGTPGSGKSTLLSKTLRNLPFRLIRYYAYVPDDRTSRQLRGESINFLHDVGLQLNEAGFRSGIVAASDRTQLLGRLHRQLGLLHDDWEKSGRATVIMIDGLDHIPREQTPERSLLEDLPDPDQIPEGVFILLGSQTDQPLPSRIRRVIASAERRIETQPLSRAATLSIIGESELSCTLSDEDSELIFERCDGHPLALAYILNLLRTLDADGSATEVLGRLGRFDATIETQYESYWDEIADQPALRALFGLLSRIRGAIDLKWVGTWADTDAVGALRRTARHYFRRESDRWYFFHNSFREFLRSRTQEAVPGEPDPDVDRQQYRALADHCAATPVDSPNSWDELYYRCLAHDHEEAVRRATPEYFRDQFLAFRPLDAVREDIDATLLSSAEVRDVSALVRILLAGAEFQQREYHLEDTSLAVLLLAHGKHEQAMAHVRNGNHLRASTGKALEFSRGLLGCGSPVEARRVFHLAEPLPLLTGATALDNLSLSSAADDLYMWAEVAPFFLDLRDVLAAIDRVQAEAGSIRNMTAEEATRFVRRRMRSHLGYGLVDKQDWDAIDKLLEGFDLQDTIDLSNWCWLVMQVLMNRSQAGDVERARHYIRRILDVVDPATRDAEDRVLVAEWVFRILGDVEETKRWLAGVDQPETPKEISSETGFEPFKLRFRLNRLLYALGSSERVTLLVPESDNSKLRLTVLFERAVCKIASIWGRRWRGQTMTSFELVSEVKPILRFLNEDSREQEDRFLFWALRDLRKALFTLVIQAVAAHGSETLNALRDAMEQEWDSPDTQKFWTADLIRELAVALHSYGVDEEWAARRLRAVEPIMLSGSDTSGRVGQYRAQAEAWRELGCQEDVSRCLKSMLQASLGVGYRKDYQLDSWIHWLGCVIEEEPTTAADRLGWFASATQALDERAEGAAVASACRGLLGVAFRWSPRRAVRLFSWFVRHGLIWYADGLHDLLLSALEADPASTQIVLPLYNHLYLTISPSGAADIAGLIVSKCATQGSHDDPAQAAGAMLASIGRYGLSSTRPHMRHSIAKGLQDAGVALSACGLSDADLSVPEADMLSPAKLQLDDSELTTTEVLQQVSCLDDMEALLQREDPTSHFEWTEVVRRLAVNLSCDGLVRLAAMFSHKHRNVDVLCAIAAQLRANGATDLAWSVGLQALESSDVYGWDPDSGGGSRIKSCEALVSIKPVEARELAYRRLVQDVAEDYKYPANIVLNLARILPLLADEVPLSETWAELESHVHALFEDVEAAPEVVELLTAAPECDTGESAMVDLLALHLDHPVPKIAQGAQRGLGDCVSKHLSSVDRLIVESLEGGGRRQESVLMVLDAVSLAAANEVGPYSDHLRRLTTSPNLWVRQAAEAICSRLGIAASTAQPKTKALAPVYEFALPTHSTIHSPSIREIASHKPMPDSDVPQEMLRPFNRNLKIIAELLRLDPENLYYRAAQIMRELEPEESWCSSAEVRLRSTMNSTGLAFTFRRPRSVLARRAMFHVVAELVDAGRLDRGQLTLLGFLLRTYDPATVLLEPAPRPAAVAPIRVSDEYQVARPEWIEAVADAIVSSPFEHADGLVVLAEETSLECLEISHPKEQRQSLVCNAEAAHEEPGEEGYGFFHGVKQHWISEYLTLGARGSPPPIVIRHVGVGYDSPADSWLALNPAVGEELGWTPSEDGLFAWVDDNHNVMVESLWWVDGVHANHGTAASREEVGEGWIVLASQKALEQLRGICPVTVRRQRIERQYSGDAGSTQANSLIRETAI